MDDEDFDPHKYVMEKVKNHEFGLSFAQDPRFINSWDQSKVRYYIIKLMYITFFTILNIFFIYIVGLDTL